jgi:hypothetical protein
METISQIMPYLQKTPNTMTIQKVFEMPEGLTIGDYEESLDRFCQDSQNAKISIANAFGLVLWDLTG